MKERPILFSAPMVRAILEGRKTQTRRVVKFPKPLVFDGVTGQVQEHYSMKAAYPMPLGGYVFWSSDPGKEFSDRVYRNSRDGLMCPYGEPGDRLWVRETFALERWDDEPKTPNDRPIYRHDWDGTEFDSEYWLWPHYKATDPAPELCYEDDENDDGEPKVKWKPSIHMPRWASRIMLEIVDVRVDRLQDINRNEAKAEGVSHVWEWPGGKDKKYFSRGVLNPCVANFSVLWDDINAARGFGWSVNPWVWVIEFKKRASNTQKAGV